MAHENALFLVVTHIEDDGCTFWAQKHSPENDSKLGEFADRLQTHANSNGSKGNAFQTNFAKSTSKTFAGQYLDDTWYRCRLLFPTQDGKCLVQYIDYGNCEEKMATSLIDIPIDMYESSIGAMAERYQFCNIVVNRDEIGNTIQYLESICPDGSLKAKVTGDAKGSHSPCQVILYDGEGVDIATRLINHGYAVTKMIAKSKVDVILSPPPVPQAQLFKNPLCSNNGITQTSYNVSRKLSFDTASIGIPSIRPDMNFDKIPGLSPITPDNKIECRICEIYKGKAEKMRLYVVKLRIDLEDSEKRCKELKKSEKHWKDLCTELKNGGAQAVISTSVDADVGVTHSQSGSGLKSDFDKNESIGAGIKRLSVAGQKYGVQNTEGENNPGLTNGFKRTPPNQCNDVKEHFSENEEVDSDVVSAEKLSDLMKKVIMPALSCYKTITNSNKIVESCFKYETEMNEVVAQIKAHIDTDQNSKTADQLGFTTKRNTVVENLKLTLQHAVQILTKNPEPMDDSVSEHVRLLGELSQGFATAETSTKKDAVDVTDIETRIKNVKTKSDVGGLSEIMMHSMSQKWNQFMQSISYRSQFQHTLEEISSYEGQEKIIKDVLSENRGIRKRKQIIRLLVTEIKNLEEQILDAEPWERNDLEQQIRDSGKKLSAERRKIQESFETRWRLMGSLADIVEKFSPELQIEYHELGIADYILKEGIVIKGMEADHLDIHGNGDEYMNAVLHRATYLGDDICLLKYSVGPTPKLPLMQALKRISIYSNVECCYTLLPIAIFTTVDATYIMVTAPPVGSGLIAEGADLSTEVIEQVLKDVATALLSLHEVGLAHGMLSKGCIYLSGNGTPKAYLSVPNFFHDQAAGAEALAKDVFHYGTLAAALLQNNSHPKIEQIISTCLEKSNAISMKDILALF